MKKNENQPLRLKRKHSLFGALKTIAYFAGFPLLFVALAIGSNQFMHFDLYQSTWSWSIILGLIVWAVCGAVQIVMACVVRGKQSQNIKTIVVAVVTIICILACCVGIDFYGSKTMQDINAKYAPTQSEDGTLVAKQVTIPTYRFSNGESETITWTMSTTEVSFPTINYLKGHYVSKTTDYDSENDLFKANVEKFCRIYNLEPLGELKKKSTEGKDTYVTNSDFSKSKVDAATGLPVNDNGLVSESYIYSMDFALNVLINYHEAVNAFAALDLDPTTYVDQKDGESVEEYAARLAGMSDEDKMEAFYNHELDLVHASPEYAAYLETEEYKAAYGENGSAKKFMLTYERIETILPELVKYVLFVLSYNELTNGFIFNTVNGMLNLVEYDADGNLTGACLLGALQAEGDMYDNAIAWADVNLPAILGLLGMDWETLKANISKQMLLDLIEDYFYYYSPSARPDFDFLGEAKVGDHVCGTATTGVEPNTKTFTAQQMRAYAFARYYAKLNGAVIGSVLVPNNDAGIGALVNGDGHIGMVTMNDAGYDASFAYSLAQLYQLKADSEYIPELFPILAARRHMYAFVGLVVLSVVLFYQFGRREEEVLAEMLTYCQREGGAQK